VRGRHFVPGTGAFADTREARLDKLGDLIADHMDTEKLAALIENGAPADLPTIETEVRRVALRDHG
jgi:adenosylcobyric acid synthase